MQKLSRYEGWSDHRTFSVNVFIENTRPLYEGVLKIYKLTHSKREIARKIKLFYEKSKAVPEKPSSRDVNWEEIVEHWAIKFEELEAAGAI